MQVKPGPWGNMDVDRHSVIVDAIATGDAAAAFSAVEEHLSWAATNLTTTF